MTDESSDATSGTQNQRTSGFSSINETLKKAIALATADADYGLMPADTAKAEAQAIANEERKPVTLRDPVTDKVLATVRLTRGRV